MTTLTNSTPLIGVGSLNPGNVSGTFIPTLWSGKLNTKLYATTVFGEICNTDWQGEISGLGDKVIINNIPNITVSDYTVGLSGMATSASAPGATAPVSQVELAINRAKSYIFPVQDVVKAQSKVGMMEMFSNDAAKQLQIAIDTSILWGQWSGAAGSEAVQSGREGMWADPTFTGSSPYSGVANPILQNSGSFAGRVSGNGSSIGYDLGSDLVPVNLAASTNAPLDLILRLAAVLDEQNVPDEGRWLIIDPATRLKLLGTNLASALQMGDAKSPVRNGKLGMIDRFQIYVSNLLPRQVAGKDFYGNTTTGAAHVARRILYAGHKSAMTFASQIVTTETIRNPNDFGDIVRGLTVYGAKLVLPTALAVARVTG